GGAVPRPPDPGRRAGWRRQRSVARLWRGRADPVRARRPRHDSADQQSPHARRAGRLWPRHRRRAPDSRRRMMARILIVEARFYAHLNDLLLDGARGALAGHEVDVITVPGALEIPGAIALAAESGDYDAFVALGV